MTRDEIAASDKAAAEESRQAWKDKDTLMLRKTHYEYAFLAGIKHARENDERVKKLVDALDEILKMRPYRCWTCDGGERYVDELTEALEAFKAQEPVE